MSELVLVAWDQKNFSSIGGNSWCLQMPQDTGRVLATLCTQKGVL